MTATGPVTITAPAGLSIISPGGNRTVDFLFDKIGGILKDTFGMEHSNFGAKYENGGLFIGMTGNKLEHAAVAINFKGLLLETKGINLKDIGTVVDKGSLTAWLKGFVTFA
jgi:type VI secretion system secreted protein VgrG